MSCPPPPPDPWEVQDFVLYPAWCGVNPHPSKGEDGAKKIYVAGDTENIPEMKVLKDIDITFLPMNLPFTMRPEMVSDAAKAFKPKILYPYRFGNTDTSKLPDLMKDAQGIELRIQKMK